MWIDERSPSIAGASYLFGVCETNTDTWHTALVYAHIHSLSLYLPASMAFVERGEWEKERKHKEDRAHICFCGWIKRRYRRPTERPRLSFSSRSITPTSGGVPLLHSTCLAYLIWIAEWSFSQDWRTDWPNVAWPSLLNALHVCLRRDISVEKCLFSGFFRGGFRICLSNSLHRRVYRHFCVCLWLFLI